MLLIVDSTGTAIKVTTYLSKLIGKCKEILKYIETTFAQNFIVWIDWRNRFAKIREAWEA